MSDETVLRDALTQHYVAHGLPPNGGADAAWFRLRLGPISLWLPNPPARRRALLMHDVNHIATGYNTIFSQGEVTIAAFEIGAGCGPFLIAWIINLSAMAAGLLISPRAVFAAYVRGRRSKSIYHDPPALDVLASTTVGALRQKLGLMDAAARPTRADYVTFALWNVPGLVLLSLPTLSVLTALWLASRIFRS